MIEELLAGRGGVAALLLAVRCGVALRLIPLVGGRPLPWGAWLALVAALLPVVAGAMPVPPVIESWPFFAVSLAREAAIGACLGLLVRLALAVFETAGAMADAAVRAFPEPDAAGSGQVGPHGTLFTVVGIAAFLATGGHRILIAAICGSIAAFPAGGLPTPSGVLEFGAAGLAAGAFAVALAVAGPLFIAGLAADLAVALLARADPFVASGASTQAARSLAVHVALVVFLGAGVTLATEAAVEGLARIPGAFAVNSS
ncbi:MAG TPA: flagellar biosynthetic protein FliR [Polyangia bacterium]|nr:flagellar biosynthetic protein FliR [Polyangia bacterium]